MSRQLADRPVPPAIDDVVKRWDWFLCHEKKLSHHTQRAYLSDINGFIDFLPTQRKTVFTFQAIETATIGDFRAWLSYLAAHGLGASTRRRMLAAVKSFYHWLDRQDLAHNAAIAVVQSPKLPRKLPRPVAAATVLALIETVGTHWTARRDHALFMLLYGCGLRINEALALDRAAWEKNNGFIRVTGKGGRERQVPVLRTVEAAMTRYLVAQPLPQPLSAPLFLGPHGGRLTQNYAQKIMRRRRQDLGLPETVTPHALRHSFATHLLQNGANLREIQELLGHASLSTTQIYAELDGRKLAEEYKKAMPQR